MPAFNALAREHRVAAVLTVVPSEIGQLSRLTNLGLEGKQLTQLPPEIRPSCRLPGAAVKAGLDETLLKEVAPKLQLMERLTSTLIRGELDVPGLREETDELVTRAEGAGLRELHGLLLELDPKKRWGRLKRVLTPAALLPPGRAVEPPRGPLSGPGEPLNRPADLSPARESR